jgi:hypothetical protein
MLFSIQKTAVMRSWFGMMRLRAWLGAVSVGVVATSASFVSAADPSAADKETGRALFAQGMAALDSHDFHGAERACGGVVKIVNVPPGQVCWAKALEGLGKLVEARDAYLAAAHHPSRPDEPTVFTSARAEGVAGAERLERRIATIWLDIAGLKDDAPLRVTIDGVEITSAVARLPRRVNPGQHAITVAAKGFATATMSVEVSEGEERHVPMSLAPGAPRAAATRSATPQPSESAHDARAPVLALAVGGVGIAGVIVGAATALAATSKHSTLQGECSGSVCPSSANGDLGSFHTLRAISAVGYIVGALGLVGGATLWFVTPPRASESSARLWIGPGSAGVAGTF